MDYRTAFAALGATVLVAGLTGSLAACGDDETTAGTTTTTTTTSGTTTTGQGGSGGGGTGGDATGGTGGAGTGGSGGQGGSVATLNGCTKDAAQDQKGKASVTISDLSAWNAIEGHQACIVVDAGTEVVWKGDFASHPLSGGATGTPDAGSPITKATEDTGSITVKLDTAGEYPYYCAVHLSGMQGVVYVE